MEKKKGQIKEIEKPEDFKDVYQVFSGEPYNEKYTDKELQEIFEEYKEKGYIYGAYDEEKCLGLIALEDGAKKDHPIEFKEGEKVMYLADIAVLDSYRRTGLGTDLMIYGTLQSKVLGYQKLYMRTLEQDKSMSYRIARRIGFNQIPDVYQMVERERTDGSRTAVKNIFLDCDLEALDIDIVRKTIDELYNNNKENERE
ncbi:MAG: GNAT family N-acetyltransferase [Clostridia bacterium]|nr:GNAT family N-acetyltransferase [Clostridia bacterium]